MKQEPENQEEIIVKTEVTVDNDKFGEVFDAINKNVVRQTNFLRGIQETNTKALKIQEATKDALEEGALDSSRQDQLESVKEAVRETKNGTEGLDVTDIAHGNFMASVADSIRNAIFGTATVSGLFKKAVLAISAPIIFSGLSGVIEGFTGLDAYGLVKEYLFGNQDDVTGIARDRSAQAIGMGIGLIVGGPLGAATAAVSSSLVGSFERVTGIDVPHWAETSMNALAGIFGVPVARGMSKIAFQQLVKGLAIRGALGGMIGPVFAAITSPISLAIVGVAAATAALAYTINKLNEAAEKRKAEAERMINEALGNPDDLEANERTNFELKNNFGTYGEQYSVDNDFHDKVQNALDETARNIMDSWGDKITIPDEFAKSENDILGALSRIVRERLAVIKETELETDENIRKIYDQAIEAAREYGVTDPDALYVIPDSTSDRSIGVRMIREYEKSLDAVEEYVSTRLEGMRMFRESMTQTEEYAPKLTTPLTFGYVQSLATPEETGILREYLSKISPETQSKVNQVNNEGSQAPVIVLNNVGNTVIAPDNRSNIVGGGGGNSGGGGTVITYGADHLKGNPTSRMY